MSELSDEKPNPNDSGPFRDEDLLRDGVRKVRPDATLIRTIHTETHDSLWVRFTMPCQGKVPDLSSADPMYIW